MGASPEVKGPQRPWWTLNGMWTLITFSWVNGLVAKANDEEQLEPKDAYDLQPTYDDAPEISKRFEMAHMAVKAHHPIAAPSHFLNNTTRTLIWLYWRDLLLHSLYVAAEIAIRVISPLILRQFLLWLQADDNGETPPLWRGWLLAFALGVAGFGMAIMHHRLFWVGMRMGWVMRQQCVAAVHAKALRLNAAAVAHISQGHVVNLVSNDVRRFDDAMPFWVFLWAGPLELGIVLLMVSLELGFLPALAGVSATLMLIPMQSILVKPVAGIRRATAEQTDERVRLAGEVITGALAMKMLSWELPFSKALGAIRRQEAHHIRHMARIRAVNQSMVFGITPLVAFVTFAVYRAMNGELSVASVFYSLSLLRLPALYMVQFFVLGVQSCTELRVSLRRLDKFLSTYEPPLPSHLQSQDASVKHGSVPVKTPSPANGDQASQLTLVPHPAHLPPGVVAMRGADYDWLKPLGDMAMTSLISSPTERHGIRKRKKSKGDLATNSLGGAGGVPPTSSPSSMKGSPSMKSELRPMGVTLHDIRVTLAAGELLGICGEVGSGKSSLLAALLGELQPLPEEVYPTVTALTQASQQDVQGVLGAADQGTGPIVTGKVAYCTQVPWIVAASVRDNILFGRSFDHDRYHRVIAACALDTDIALLPAGDLTELGERGINLSGGQKARVALARAAYAEPDVALLDDPLSACDPRVARLLFNRCIGNNGLLKAQGMCTRVLITHQRQFLPQCDRVLVLRQGQVVALGTWQEIDALELPELVAGGTGAMGEVTVDEVVDQGPVLEELVDSLPMKGEVVSSSPEGTSQDRLPKVALQLTDEIVQGKAGSKATGDDSPMGVVGQGVESSSSATTTEEAEGVDRPVHRKSEGLQLAPSAMRQAISTMFAGGQLQQQKQLKAAGLTGRKESQATGDVEAGGPGKVKGPWLEEEEDEGDVHAGGPPLEPSRSVRDGPMKGKSIVWTRSTSMGPRSTSMGRMLDRVFSTRAGRLKAVTLSRMAGGGKDDDNAGTLVKDEDRVMGTVPWSIYAKYFQYIGVGVTTLLLVGLLGGQACFLASEWWLSLWSRSSAEDQQDSSWLWVYGMLAGLVVVVSITRALLFFEATVNAATCIHNEMAITVFRTPLSFFHTNPAGRILNRFSKDLGQVDDLLPVTMFDALQVGFNVFSAFILVSIAVPFILPVFIPLVIAFVWLRARYLGASREVKRWEATSRSPVFADFSATLKGLPTIRAYNAMDRFQTSFLKLLSANGAWFHAFLGVARWIGFRLDVISATVLMATALLAMATRGRVQPSMLALALTHVLQLTGFMQWFVRQTAEVENIMTSMERMLEYTKLPQEEGGQEQPPKDWPKSGALVYQNVTATYRAGLQPVLVDISFSLPGGSSCGVVGRTGSGKSSLMLTLFRLIPVESGIIMLDGVDTGKISLLSLRTQLAIIPQDPVLFSGTVRSNLDPWNLHQDDELWNVLTAAKLHPVITAAGGLNARMAEAGDNLSVGQRQLFCLARALLQRAKVLALDEATANVDRGTDALIQGALREFSHANGRVLLVIAHRIDTIMDTDNLLVLQAGKLMETGAPNELASRQGGVFASMVAAARAAHAGNAE